MKLKIIVVSSIILMIFVGSSLAFSGDRGGKNRFGNFLGKNPADMIARVVDLTESQFLQIEQIHETIVADYNAQYGDNTEGASAKEKIRALDPGSTDYLIQVEVLAETVSTKVKAKILARANERVQIYNVLTPEQRTQLAEFKDKIRSVMNARRAGKSRNQ